MKIPEAALNQHIAVLAKTGAGKTFLAKALIAEPLLGAGRQVAIIDPTSAWWGLRLSRDGKRPGFDRVIIIGGDHGDMPLRENMGEACARLVTEQGASAVFDTSDLTVGERTRWFTDFAVALYRTVRAPLHLIIDEVHNFLPQGRVPDPQAGKMLHAGSQLFSGGRSRGIRLVGITQRPAKWHKDSLTSVDSLFVLRMLAPQDRKAVEEWIDGCGDRTKGREVLESLANLQRGEAWFWFPEGSILKRFQCPAITTYDSSSSPDAATNRRDSTFPPHASPWINLEEFRAHMAQAVADAEANDPKKLRARIADLERAAKAAPVDVEAIRIQAKAEARRAFVPIIKEVQTIVGRLRSRADTIEGLLRETSSDAETLAAITASLETLMTAPAAAGPPAPAPRMYEQHTYLVDPKRPLMRQRLIAPTMQAGIQPRHLRILAAIAWFERVGIEGPTRAQVAARAGVSSTSSSYANDVSAMKTAGVIAYPGTGNLCRTDAGRRIAVEVPSGDVWDDLSKVVDPRHLKLLRALRKGAMSREQLAEAVGASATSSSFANDISKLKTLALVEYPGKGEVRLADWLK
jgi:hypothetical protein